MALLGTIVDDFSTSQLDTSRWNYSQGTITISGGAAQYNLTPTYDANRLGSGPHDASGQTLYFKVTHPAVAGAETRAYIYLDADNYVRIMAFNSTERAFRVRNGGINTEVFWAGDPAHVWWRFRNVNGTTWYADTSPDGVTWTQRATKSTTWQPTAVYAYFGGGLSSGAVAQPVLIDNVNTAGPPPPANPFRMRVNDAWTANRVRRRESGTWVLSGGAMIRTGHQVTPAVVTSYVGNPGRGQYLWFSGVNNLPVPSTLQGVVDGYDRDNWKRRNPTPGTYDWPVLRPAEAQARGGRWSWRVMAVNTTDGGDQLPADVSALASSRTIASANNARVPDWNNSSFVSRTVEFLFAAGEHFDSDQRLWAIDIGGYGNWGENHNWPYESSYPGPSGQLEISVENWVTIAKATVDAFPSKYILCTVPALKVNGYGAMGGDFTAIWEALREILQYSIRVGLRNDSIGGGSVQQSSVNQLAYCQQQAVAEGLPLTQQPLERWRYSPFVGEWATVIGPGTTDGTFAKGLAQVSDWHLAMVGNENYGGVLADYSPAEQEDFNEACRMAGFTYQVADYTYSPGGAGTVNLAVRWKNTTVAPTYDTWQVTYQLVQGSTVVHTVTSQHNLRLNLGGGQVTDDTVSFSGVSAGTYTFAARVIDPSGYMIPMRLAHQTRNADGGYPLGEVVVS